MKKKQNLAELTKDISRKLLDSLRLTEVLENQIDGEARCDNILKILKNKIKASFYNTEKCRKIISVPE